MMIKLRKVMQGFVLCACFFSLIFYVALNAARVNRRVSYWAVFESGDIVKVDSIVAVPILSAEDVDRMWPEYYAEITVNVGGQEIILRSKPFLFCDNPEMEGTHGGRVVYFPSQ